MCFTFCFFKHRPPNERRRHSTPLRCERTTRPWLRVHLRVSMGIPPQQNSHRKRPLPPNTEQSTRPEHKTDGPYPPPTRGPGADPTSRGRTSQGSQTETLTEGPGRHQPSAPPGASSTPGKRASWPWRATAQYNPEELDGGTGPASIRVQQPEKQRSPTT